MALRRRRIEIDRQQHPGEYPRHVVRQARARRCHRHILLHLHAAGGPRDVVLALKPLHLLRLAG